MKTQYFILFLFLLTAQQSAAQVTFSHTGTSNNQVNASTYIDDGERVRFEINNDSLIIYDASLQNVIAQDLIAGAPFSSGVFASIQHISRTATRFNERSGSSSSEGGEKFEFRVFVYRLPTYFFFLFSGGVY